MRRQAAAVVALCAVVCVDGFSLLRVPAASRDRVRQVCPRWLAQAERDQLQGAQEGPEQNTVVPDAQPPKPAASTTSLKQQLLRQCAVCDRGYGASTSERDQIEELVRRLASACPTPTPSAGLEGSGDMALRGAWRLIYTSAIDVLSLAANPVSSVGGVYQNVREDGVIDNLIDILNPRALSILPPSLGIDSTLRLKVRTRARERGPARVGLIFEKVSVLPMRFLGNDVTFLPSPTIDLPSVSANGGNSADSPAYFDIEYVDDELLIIRQNTAGGVDGGIFIQVKVDPTLEPVPF